MFFPSDETLFLFQIFFRIPEKTADHQQHYDSNRKCGNDTYALDVTHTALREHKCDWKDNEQNAPKQRN
jgi:hypothetical protein